MVNMTHNRTNRASNACRTGVFGHTLLERRFVFKGCGAASKSFLYPPQWVYPMKLYTLLRDRASINVLKILCENEISDKNYTMQYGALKKKLSVDERDNTLGNLEKAGLVASEKNDSGELVLSITQKGKDFVAVFDKLVEVMAGKKEEPKAYQVKYDLTWLEERMLVICSKIKAESGALVGLQALTQEVYPYKDPTRTSGTISKYAKKLEELNLMTRVKKNNRTFFDVTESGERVVEEKLVSAPLPAGI
jgi:predicted transcriptional regulator